MSELEPIEPTVTATHSLGEHVPLYERFPRLRSLPRVSLLITPSPVYRITGFPDAKDFWIKRDDMNAPVVGGNKVRSLEFLLGSVRPGDTVLTLGGAGSTHVLATAVHARRIGAGTIAFRWRHDMNEFAHSVAARLETELSRTATDRTPIGAMLRCGYLRLTQNVHFIPVGGSTPLGALGHVNAALELAEQIERGDMPKPARVVLPLATGCTMAGLALGFAIAGLDIQIIGARVGPRFFGTKGRTRRIAWRTAQAIAQSTGEKPPRVEGRNLHVVHHVYGGAYGRPLAAATEAATQLNRSTGVHLDSTYSAKAFLAALDAARSEKGPTLFWLTFDGRWLTT